MWSSLCAGLLLLLRIALVATALGDGVSSQWTPGRALDTRRHRTFHGRHAAPVRRAGSAAASGTSVRHATAPRKRAAICVSGQLRTVEATIGRTQAHLLDAIDDYDMFVYISTRETVHEPAVGEISACDVFRRKHHNVLVCEVVRVQDRAVSQFFTDEMVASYSFANDAQQIQAYIQHLYGIAEVNRMRREYSLKTGTQYDYIVRLRPDNWFFDAVPPLPPVTDANRRTMYVSDPHYMCCGNEDIFNVGPTEIMDGMMDRLYELKSFSHELSTNKERLAFLDRDTNGWSSEKFVWLYARKHNVSLQVLPGLHVHVKRWDEGSGRANSGGNP